MEYVIEKIIFKEIIEIKNKMYNAVYKINLKI